MSNEKRDPGCLSLGDLLGICYFGVYRVIYVILLLYRVMKGLYYPVIRIPSLTNQYDSWKVSCQPLLVPQYSGWWQLKDFWNFYPEILGR